MASRRLDISSLLCKDDVPEPVVLAPHLRNPSLRPSFGHSVPSPSTSPTSSHFSPSSSHSRTSRQSIPYLTPPSNPFPLPPNSYHSPHQFSPQAPTVSSKPFIGLDALVHAATEERRRLSGSSASESDIPRHPSPVDQCHLPQPFHHRPLSRQNRHPLSDDYAPSPIQQLPIQRQSPVLSPLQVIRSPKQPKRSPAYSPLLQHKHHPSHEESHIHLSPVDDLHHNSSLVAFFPPPHPPQLSGQQVEEDSHIQQIELERQRQHHEQLLLQEQQHQRLTRERQAYGERLVVRGPSMPLHIEAPSQASPHPSNITIHTSGRKSDPGLLYRSIPVMQANTSPSLAMHPETQQLPPSQVLSHPNKRRRYSYSPPRSISSEESERLYLKRERMATGDLGYGRPDTPLASRPGSSQESGRKYLGLVELVTTDRETEQIHIANGALLAVESIHDSRGLSSPLGRRSPPGSLVGRAMAARKSEETNNIFHESQRAPQPTFPERGQPLEKEDKEKAQPASNVHAALDVHNGKLSYSATASPSLSSSFSTKAQEEDAHEWFLEHYDEYPSPSPQPHQSPLRLTSSVMPSPGPTYSHPTSKTAVRKRKTPTRTAMPEAAVALEQELEELAATPSVRPSQVEPEMDVDTDVDLVVTGLVVETLEADDLKREDVVMEVDVEDELLSLVDDRPSPTMNRHTFGHLSASTKHLLLSRSADESDASQHPSPSAAASFQAPIVYQPSNSSTSDHGSMPPPPAIASSRGKEKDEKAGESAGGVTITVSVPKKTKDESKSTTRPKALHSLQGALKSRIKSTPKLKHKIKDGIVSLTKSKTISGPGKKLTISRSRSTSVMPGGSIGLDGNDMKLEPQEEEEEEAPEGDDKLYCVCKTKYDEEKFMIACDRCDEWYHTQCVNMPDLEVDLVDQFICPPCIEKNPHLSLRTTYKPRCLFGCKHGDPLSPKACHRPARGAFSKYCSDECGVKYMQSCVDAWARKGGKREKLWEAVRNAGKREGVVIQAQDLHVAKMEDTEGYQQEGKNDVVKLKESKMERDVQRLNTVLESVVRLREEIKTGLEGVVWREKLLELATERAEQVGQCGWDQRLCFGDEEWADFGAGVFESYEEVKMANTNNSGEELDRSPTDGEGEWWCTGKEVCDRHSGWQTVRYRDVCNEKEKKEDALLNLTTREREIRKRIVDILDPHERTRNDTPSKAPLKNSNAKLNGHIRRTNGDATKKGKKRKAPSR